MKPNHESPAYRAGFHAAVDMLTAPPPAPAATMTAQQRADLERARKDQVARSKLSAAEIKMLDGCKPSMPVSAKGAVTRGAVLQMPVHISQADAAARLAEIDRELGQ